MREPCWCNAAKVFHLGSCNSSPNNNLTKRGPLGEGAHLDQLLRQQPQHCCQQVCWQILGPKRRFSRGLSRSVGERHRHLRLLTGAGLGGQQAGGQVVCSEVGPAGDAWLALLPALNECRVS